ncbi:DUF806 family protein [uncultured Secundilactobacillus sp.]|uniref:DUF806 family protein n=1 Tax=uncultured Secundilactobacillus sp. TaxID=2813935 RepID=UPI0025833434|nr:DUF806 family protein [uncultured Secundilactobacillus sp.]
MAPVIEVAKLIKDFDWLDTVYTGLLPEEVKSDDQQTIGLITETRNAPATYGGNSFWDLSIGVQIEVFFAEDFTQDMTMISVDLMKLLEKSGWRIENSRPLMIDPDTNQLIKVWVVGKLKEI